MMLEFELSHIISEFAKSCVALEKRVAKQEDLDNLMLELLT